MSIAVIETGGKQYVVAEGQNLQIEKLPVEAGSVATFGKVLLLADGDAVRVGTPYLEGVSVTANVTAQTKTDKITGVKFHNKVRYRRFFGHRQQVTKVTIGKLP